MIELYEFWPAKTLVAWGKLAVCCPYFTKDGDVYTVRFFDAMLGLN
jgi:hypothetical protein